MNESFVSAVGASSAFRGAPGVDPANSFEASRDRILITLLALNLMLMAFFVVLNSTATIDGDRSAEVARSMPAKTPAVIDATGGNKSTEPAATLGGSPRVEASAALRDAVADVFAILLPAGAGVTMAEDDGRVDVDLPMTVVSSFVSAGEDLPAAVLDGLAHVMANPPAGYHTELLINTEEAGDTARLAHLAQELVTRGVASTELSVGMLAKSQDAPAREGAQTLESLRFTFLLLEPGEDSNVRLAAPPRRP